MKHTVLLLLMAATVAASAQTAAKPAAPAAKPATAAKSAASATGVKLPPGVPPAKGVVKSAFTLRYQDVKIGTGPEAEPNKLYKVHYTVWLAADGRKLDSSYDHRNPVLDKDNKPVMGEDGKPKLGEPVPFSFPQGMPPGMSRNTPIPGFDQGFGGMRIGGQRRIFIPWQLAYGAHGRPGPDAAHPGVPPKADLIFDVELLDVTDLPMPPSHPGMGGMPSGRPMPGMNMPHPGAPSAPATPAAPAAPAVPATPATPAVPATPAAPTAPATPQAK
jgi:peptidylprolyl isomerase